MHLIQQVKARVTSTAETDNAQRAADGQRTFVYLDSDYIREQFSQGLHVTPVPYGGHLVRAQRKTKAPKETH